MEQRGENMWFDHAVKSEHCRKTLPVNPCTSTQEPRGNEALKI